MPFEEKTWKWAITPEGNSHADRSPIEGTTGERDDDWRAAVLERLEDREKWPNVEFIVFVQNMNMDARLFGAYNVVVAGPEYTWGRDQIEELKENPSKYWMGDLPSERMQPQWYISREEHFKTKEKALGRTNVDVDQNRGEAPGVEDG